MAPTVHTADENDEVDFYAQDSEPGGDDEYTPVAARIVDPLPEAAFSVNFRMNGDGETHQFTVRGMDAVTFLADYKMLRADLLDSGFVFPGHAPAPQYQPPSPVNGTQPRQVSEPQYIQPGRPLPPPQAQPVATTAYNPDAANSMGWKAETIDGYVVGSYTDKKTGEVKVALYLFTPNMKFKSYTVYPERTDLVPFPMPTKVEWRGGAPDRAAAEASKMMHSANFVLNVLPDFNDDGTPKQNKSGYQVYRVPTRAEMQAIGAPVVAPPSIPVDPSQNNLDGESLGFAMSDHHEVAKEYKLPDPLDEWFVEQRQVLSKIMDGPRVKKATAMQFNMLGDWARDVATGGKWGNMLPIAGLGNIPLAGVVMGILCDRFVTEPEGVPDELSVYLLQRTQKMRGKVLNNLYDEAFDQNLAEVVRLSCEAIMNDALPF